MRAPFGARGQHCKSVTTVRAQHRVIDMTPLSNIIGMMLSLSCVFLPIILSVHYHQPSTVPSSFLLEE